MPKVEAYTSPGGDTIREFAVQAWHIVEDEHGIYVHLTPGEGSPVSVGLTITDEELVEMGYVRVGK